jgi:hypothetical protein
VLSRRASLADPLLLTGIGGYLHFGQRYITNLLVLVGYPSFHSADIANRFMLNFHLICVSTAGIPSTFNFRKEGQPGLGEIDFIVASIKTDKGMLKHFISTPLYTLDGNNGLRKLRTMGPDREVEVLLAEGTDYATDISAKSDTFAGNAAEIDSYFDLNWGITWEGFDPASEGNIYAIKWTDTSIEWYAGSKDNVPLRITLKKVPPGETFPKGPLP